MAGEPARPLVERVEAALDYPPPGETGVCTCCTDPALMAGMRRLDRRALGAAVPGWEDRALVDTLWRDRFAGATPAIVPNAFWPDPAAAMAFHAGAALHARVEAIALDDGMAAETAWRAGEIAGLIEMYRGVAG